MIETLVGDSFVLPPGPPLGALELRIVPLDFVMHWHRCGLAADYFAAHMAYSFENRDAVRTVLATVLNELIENAVKFSADKAGSAHISMLHYGETIAIETHSHSEPRRAQTLTELVRALHAGSAETMFLERLATPTSDPDTPSGLGLLVLKKDYDVALSVQCQPQPEGTCEVRVRALLQTSALEER